MTVSHIILHKMAVTMALAFWIPLVLSVFGANAAGEFSILHSPDSLKFTGSSKTFESLLKEIFSAALGLSVEENSEWKGMYVVDPFNTPEAVVEVYIDGVSTLGESAGLKSKTFPLTADEYEPGTFESVKHRIKQRFTSKKNKISNVKLCEDNEVNSDAFKNIFGELIIPKVNKEKLDHLKPSIEEDYHFLNELATLQAITGQVQAGSVNADNLVDFYSFRFCTLHALSDFHGPNSLQAEEAKKLLGEALNDLSKAFVKAYDGSVLVTAVTTDVAHTRRAVRSVREKRDDEEEPTTTASGTTTTDKIESNPIKDDGYSADYPAIFNIILWFGVVISFSLLAIVHALMDMDPGRDSIIYRMTSTRMKKDN